VGCTGEGVDGRCDGPFVGRTVEGVASTHDSHVARLGGSGGFPLGSLGMSKGSSSSRVGASWSRAWVTSRSIRATLQSHKCRGTNTTAGATIGEDLFMSKGHLLRGLGLVVAGDNTMPRGVCVGNGSSVRNGCCCRSGLGLRISSCGCSEVGLILGRRGGAAAALASVSVVARRLASSSIMRVVETAAKGRIGDFWIWWTQHEGIKRGNCCGARGQPMMR